MLPEVLNFSIYKTSKLKKGGSKLYGLMFIELIHDYLNHVKGSYGKILNAKIV